MSTYNIEVINMIRHNNLNSIKKEIKSINVNNYLDHMENTPLHYAIIFNKPEIISYLISIGAEKYIKNSSGDNCIKLACRYTCTYFFDKDYNKIYTDHSKKKIELYNKIENLKKLNDNLSEKLTSAAKENNELKECNNKLKRKNEFLETSYDKIIKKIKK